MCQRLQRRAEAVFHLPGAIGNASKLSKIAAKKRNDPIGLSERVCLQYNRIALMESHTELGNSETAPRPRLSKKRDLEK
jgi:hypothetical protein